MKPLFKILTGVATALALSTQVANAQIKVGVSAEPYPPFAEKAADGTWKGWEIDIIGAVCNAMNEKCQIVPVAWDGIIPALLAKKMDVIMASMSITDKRKKTIAFSDKYYDTPSVIVSPKNAKLDGTPESVKGKIIGVQVSTTNADYVVKYYTGKATIKSYGTFDEHNQDLVAGRVDGVVGDLLAFTPFLNSKEGNCCAVTGKLRDPAIFGLGVGAGMRKEDTALAAKINAAIKKIRADGTYDKISKKYFEFSIY